VLQTEIKAKKINFFMTVFVFLIALAIRSVYKNRKGEKCALTFPAQALP
jgi:hypothetical protein